MTFDLVLSTGFKTPVTVTVIWQVTKKEGPRQRRGKWAIKKAHWHLFRLIAKTTYGTMYSSYNTDKGLPFVFCYNDQSDHNPGISFHDPALAFGCYPAPLDDSDPFKHLTKGVLKIFQPANATMKDFEGRWMRWV